MKGNKGNPIQSYQDKYTIIIKTRRNGKLKISESRSGSRVGNKSIGNGDG